MAKLDINPMYENSGKTDHVDANLIAYTVAPLPRGIAGYLLREQEGWRYETVVAGRERALSDVRFDSATEAAVGLEQWLDRTSAEGVADFAK